jgi:GMP synthase (glutamine-hydrolysing)
MAVKPFLILQLRPEDEAADDELAAIMKSGRLDREHIVRYRIDQGPLPKVNLDDFSGVIVGGGPFNVSDPEHVKTDVQKRLEADLHDLLDKVIALDFPYLGACYGLGILAQHLGGEVSKKKYSENVEALDILLTEEANTDPLTGELPMEFRAFAGHKESVQDTPPNAVLLARSHGCPVHMIRFQENIYGTQFHPELDKDGLALRINIYRNAGYFPPEDADKLIAAAEPERIIAPPMILENFVNRYLERSTR